MSAAVVNLSRIPPVPWRDPQALAPRELERHIAALEQACRRNPENAGLHTCLGMAYAMNYEAYKSMDALETATRIAPDHFFARFKYAELFFRLRALDRALEETLKALDLAENTWEAAMCRRQLSEIRRLRREGTQKPAWTRPLTAPAVVLAVLLLVSSAVVWL